MLFRSAVNEKGWLSYSRTWQPGDTVVVTLPQKAWLHALDKERNGPNAFMHGPVALAAIYTGTQTPNDQMNVRKLIDRLIPVPGRPLHYTVEGCDTLSFKPFYEFKENERYFIYHDTTAHATIRFP